MPLTRLTVAGLGALFVAASTLAAPVPPGAAPPRLSAPVTYRDLMLVLVNKDGAAAVVFSDPDEKGTAVSYSFRYESADGQTTKAGKGKLFERRLPVGGYDPDGLSLNAGAITLEWSMGGPERGWIYYLPEALAVHIANARDFEDRFELIPGGQKQEYKKLDLKRFMTKK